MQSMTVKAGTHILQGSGKLSSAVAAINRPRSWTAWDVMSAMAFGAGIVKILTVD